MTAYEFSQPWLSEVNGKNAMSAMEFAHLRSYLAGVDNGTVQLFNPNFLYTTIGTLTLTNPLGVVYGGTGLAAVAQGDLLYGSAANVLSLLNKNTTATRYLSNTGTSNNPAWAQVVLTDGVSGVLPVANGGTNSSTALANGLLMTSSGGKVVEIAGNVSAGSNKITSLANGSSAQDAAAFGQIPTYSAWTSYTPTITGCGTVSNTNFFWRQLGDSVFVVGSWKNGTVSATEVSIEMPSGKSIATSKIPTTTANTALVGHFVTSKSEALATNNDLGALFSDGSTTDKIYLCGTGSNGNGLLKTAGNGIFSSNNYVMVKFDVAV